jgi:glutamine synthetase
MTGNVLPPGVENVSVCVPDHYGRLAGKLVAASRMPEILASGLPMPDFHLITGPDVRPAAGLAVTGEHTGFPNDLLWPDMHTFRRLPWDPATGLVLSDARRPDGTIVTEAPRAILRRQAERLASHGLSAWVATELEFYVYSESYRRSFRKRYQRLTPLYHRNGDNDVLVTGLLERYLRPLRSVMTDLGAAAETTQGEGGVGQAEINFPASAPVSAADSHVLFKHAAKAVAHQQSRAVTFMAMPDQEQPGSGCHLHLSLRDGSGRACMADDGSRHRGGDPAGDPAGGPAATELSPPARRFLAGVLAFSPELALLHAPLVNSYRRLQPGGWAPSAATWGRENRAAMVRVVGSGPSLRLEFRLPGADANPYLAIAALLAAGVGGLEDDGIELPPAMRGTAAPETTAGAGHRPPIPLDLAEALRRFEESKLAASAFGETVCGHVAGMAHHELRLARSAVTDWELERGFESA